MSWQDICRFCSQPIENHEQCCVGVLVPGPNGSRHPHFQCNLAPSGWRTRAELEFNSEEEAVDELRHRTLLMERKARGL